MKNVLIVLSFIFLAGCASTTERIETIVDDPGAILQDPGFASYQQNLDDLERQYLQKKITYAEYLQQKNRIEEGYSQEVQHHRETIENSGYSGGKHEAFR